MPETIKLTVRQIIEAAAGLKRLDGIVRGRENEPFEMSSSTVWNIAKNQVILDRHLEDFNAGARAMSKNLKVNDGDTMTPAVAARFSELKDAVEVEKNKEISVSGILMLKLSSLIKKPATTASKIKENPIPPTVLAQLMPILDEDYDPAKAD